VKRTWLSVIGSLGVGGVVYGVGAGLASMAGKSGLASIPVIAVAAGASLLFFVASESGWESW
jgi:hypothetical protein